MRLARLLTIGAFLLSGCGLREGDLPADNGEPPAAGKDQRIHEIRDPNSDLKARHEQPVAVSGAVVVAIDQFDETRDGRGAGTIYVSDLGSKEPYSGISLYNPSFIPGNLRVAPGDTLDLRGSYQENQDIPLAFAKGAFLIQLANPIGTFRFETRVPEPVVINIEDLSDYEKGRRWLNMLVTVKNVTLDEDLDENDVNCSNKPTTSPRHSARLMPNRPGMSCWCADPFPKAPTIVNELMDTSSLQLKAGTVLKSLTGVVTFFCNLHIAPRSPADVVR